MTNKLSEIFSYDLIKELKETYLTNNTIKSKALIKKQYLINFQNFITYINNISQKMNLEKYFIVY